MKIYVASSWRNPWQPGVVKILRDLGHEVYDFRNPTKEDHGFSWREIDPDWKSWSPERYRQALKHPASERGFSLDMEALEACDACVLVHPCGASAHLELGWAIGAGKKTAVLFPHGIEITPVGGHSCAKTPCAECYDRGGCSLPYRLNQIEPELMAKAAHEILINADELVESFS